jgi:hypothetical protein
MGDVRRVVAPHPRIVTPHGLAPVYWRLLVRRVPGIAVDRLTRDIRPRRLAREDCGSALVTCAPIPVRAFASVYG